MTASPPAYSQGLTTLQRTAVFMLFFTSGFAGLVYEVLWMKELGLLFGNTAQAAATTLAAFFLGMASGGLAFGRISKRSANPLGLYALLEAGVTVSALLYFVLLDLYHATYGTLFDGLHIHAGLFVTTKFLLALGILLPPAFFMGGTLPVMSQFLVRQHDRLGTTASVLYAINTTGAAFGALAAGFFLPRWLGFTNAYLVALAITASVAVFAWLLAQRLPRCDRQPPTVSDSATYSQLQSWQIRMLALLSGFITLGLEVLWTRMFAQVMQNSVYTFSAILVIFLLALAIGAAVARALAGRRLPQLQTLITLMLCGGLLAGASPLLFNSITNGLQHSMVDTGWLAYVVRVFVHTAVVILPAGILLGAVFPYLLKISESMKQTVGQTVGDLAAVNTLGAVLGSLSAGFVLLEIFGLWHSLQLMAGLYLLLALVLTLRLPVYRLAWTGALAGCLVLLATVLEATSLPLVTLDPDKKKEFLVEMYEGSGASVAVVTRNDSLRIKVNNYYGIGGSGDHKNEERQSHLPLLIHPEATSVFYLGMGTGITAGAALQHPGVERIVVTEILPDVVRATREHFGEWLHGLYEDPRAEVIAEDGRNYLHGTAEIFDLIIADLFVPWKAGAGTLYSKEHYTAARKHLGPKGIYAQWLPLFQLTRREFDSIARTMLEVFPQVTVWRSKFHGRVPIMLLAGHKDTGPLDLQGMRTRLSAIKRDVPADHASAAIGNAAVPATAGQVLMHYGGNLSRAAGLFADSPFNTDDRPFIEYSAPVSQARTKAGKDQWFRGESLASFYKLMLRVTPPEQDPYLKNSGPDAPVLVQAGNQLHSQRIYRQDRNTQAARRAELEYKQLMSKTRSTGKQDQE
ncbi:MAG: fused MFS/spermidine synthase [Pseudomonadota bacterium]